MGPQIKPELAPPAPSVATKNLSRTLTILLSCLTLIGATPTFWTVSTHQEFLEGELDSLAIDSNGHLTLGPVIETVVDTSAPILWTLTTNLDGRQWMGSGNQGRLYRVDVNNEENIAFVAEELDIHTVVADADGGILFATSPEGRVYHLRRNNSPVVLFDPAETYIWALALAADGTLYVATGNVARIYRIQPGRQPELFFESDASHILSLSISENGDIFAGTESPGQVLRIDPTGGAFVLLDTPYEEVRSLRTQPEGALLAVAVSGQGSHASTTPPTPETQGSLPVPSVTVTTSVTATVGSNRPSPPTQSATSQSTPQAQAGAVYRIAADGFWDVLWQSTTDTPLDAIYRQDGTLLIGTGPDGKIFQVTNNPNRTLLLGRAPANQITRFLNHIDGSLRYTTANPGRLMELRNTLAPSGTYTSSIRDATTVARWGTLTWQASVFEGNNVEIRTRSGNTAIPNSTWSDWSAPYDDPGGSQIASPNARYLQWRAFLSAGTSDGLPTLTSVRTAYLPRNIRPRVTELTIHPPGTAFQRALSTGDPPLAGLDELDLNRAVARSTTLGRQTFRKGIQTFVWRASDGNGDPLQYTVSVQHEGDGVWRELATALRETVFAWDTSRIPDGSYRIRVSATDGLSNSPDSALEGDRRSAIFKIDNTPPTITVSDPRQTTLNLVLPFTVRDTHSAIKVVEVSRGYGDWQVVYPTDGIPDGPVESFQVPILDSQDEVTLIRATDEIGNAVTVSTQ